MNGSAQDSPLRAPRAKSSVSQPGRRPKSDRYDARVMALADQGLNYRLIARDVDISANTVMAIVRRHRAANVPPLSAYCIFRPVLWRYPESDDDSQPCHKRSQCRVGYSPMCESSKRVRYHIHLMAGARVRCKWRIFGSDEDTISL